MTNQTGGEAFAAYWPGGANAVHTVDPAPRPDRLDGKTIGFLWDYMFRGEEIFPVIEGAIKDRFPDTNVVGYETFGSIFGGDEHAMLRALPERLRAHKIDAVVCGIGC